MGSGDLFQQRLKAYLQERNYTTERKIYYELVRVSVRYVHLPSAELYHQALSKLFTAV